MFAPRRANPGYATLHAAVDNHLERIGELAHECNEQTPYIAFLLYREIRIGDAGVGVLTESGIYYLEGIVFVSPRLVEVCTAETGRSGTICHFVASLVTARIQSL